LEPLLRYSEVRVFCFAGIHDPIVVPPTLVSILPKHVNPSAGRGIPFKTLAVARHRVAEKKVAKGRKQIGFDAESSPGRLSEGNLDRRQKIEESDDHDEGGVLEKADKRIDQGRDRKAWHLG
jgi:hypothetical protein